MDKWCKTTDIKVTPTIFINGKQMPDVHINEDLQYFLAEQLPVRECPPNRNGGQARQS